MRSAAWIAALAIGGCARAGYSPVSESTGASRGDAKVINAPSCVGLAPTCGPQASTPCCESPLVPGGTFYRSHDVGTDGMFADESFPATVSAFRLDKYEVTVGRFRKFVEAGMGTQQNPPAAGAGAHPKIAGSGWSSAWATNLPADTATLMTGLKCNASYQTWTDTPGSGENLPINCITWYEAFAFCAWDGGFLPTEAEWNYAAAGGDQQRAYPWSSPASAVNIDCAHANYSPASGYCVDPPNGGLMPVGSDSPAGDGRWGQADLAGNVWEKVLDTYDDPYTIADCHDCADLSAIDVRTVRGGAFNSADSSTRTASRYYDPPTDPYIEMGVRCARSP